MGRKTLTPEDRFALAQSRGYSAQSTLDRQNQLSQTEQSLLAGATKDLHEHVGEIWHEFLAVKGLKLDASLQLEPVILKDFVQYYASSRYGRIGELPTVHRIATIWYRFVGYQNRITSSKLDRQLVNDVAAFIGVSLRQKLDLSTKKRDKYLVTFKDLTRLMTHLWCFHDHDYLHERYRVQLSLMLILFASCGDRAGAIVESSSYRGTNQALAYKRSRTAQMPSNKIRLYIALYARGGTPTMPGGEDTYHWALLVGPKDEVEGEQGTRYHAKERLVAGAQMRWVFEELPVPLQATNMLLVRIMIGKVEKMDRLVDTLRSIPIRQGEQGWNCVSWVREALKAIQADGKALGTAIIG